MKTIYVVEDDNDIRGIVELILSQHGFCVKSFEKPSSFRNEMQKRLPDLILLDVMLPEENGNDICKEFKTYQTTSHIPIIMMSAQPFKSSENFANDYISKPFDVSYFVRTIDKQLI